MAEQSTVETTAQPAGPGQNPPPGSLQSWRDSVTTYEKTFKEWEKRGKLILDKYRDEKRHDESDMDSARFNILWSNTQTLKNATFARLPKPDVSRRFRDTDPIGRVASLILERALDYEVQHYPDYKATLTAVVLDRFLPGRGTAWVRYEPRFKPVAAMPQAAEAAAPAGGLQVTEDVERGSAEVLDIESVPCDYVHWTDFGHSVARTWEEVSRVWRKVYMTKPALEERFGAEKAKTIPMDASPKKDTNDRKIKEDEDRACIYEGWDKDVKKAYWFSQGTQEFLDERDDPLGLGEFFPCPRPMFATLTNDSLVPVPDYALYQDQGRQLDLLAERIKGLVHALQVRGVYDATQESLKRLFSEGNPNELLPVKNWAAFAEKQGLTGAIDLVDLTPIAAALMAAYQAFDQVKNQIYEITRISDIMRGFVDPEEKLGQSQLKTQYSNLGIKAYQDQVAMFATELLQLKAQIMCNKFEPKTLLQLGAADQLTVSDSDVLAAAPQLGQPTPPDPRQPPQMGPDGQPIPPQPGPPPIKQMPKEAKQGIVIQAALKLLLGERAANPEAKGVNPLRSFRVEVQADSLVQMDEEAEKKSRMEFLEAEAGFVERFVTPMMQAPPHIQSIIVPVMMEMWKFGSTAFKVGRNIEGAFDEAADQLKELAANPQAQQPDPEQMKQMQEQAMQAAEGQVTQSNAQKEAAFNAKSAKADIDHASRSADLDVREMKFDAAQAIADEKWKARAECERLANTITEQTLDRKIDEQLRAKKEVEREGKEVEKARGPVTDITEKNDRMLKTVEAVARTNEELNSNISALHEAVSAERELIRDPRTGKASGSRIKKGMQR